MKVTSVNPGTVYMYEDVFYYTYFINGRVHDMSPPYSTANAAKQAMREKVAQERKRHLTEN